MNGKMSEFEVMAPVGSRESLAAAIQAGADSVYFGVGRLNMRAGSASAFTLDDLKEIADTCHEHGIKSYLTVNTIIYDDDMEEMRQTLSAACEAGISAIIASDMAVLQGYRGDEGTEVRGYENSSEAEATGLQGNLAPPYPRTPAPPKTTPKLHLSTQLNISTTAALRFYA